MQNFQQQNLTNILDYFISKKQTVMHSYRSQRSQSKNIENNQNTLNQKTSRFKTPPMKNLNSHSNKKGEEKLMNHNSIATKKKKIIRITLNKQMRKNEDLREQSTRQNTMVCMGGIYDKKISDFEIVKDMGRGKFGFVYAAKEKSTDFLVALKKMSKKDLKQNHFEQQVKREIIIQAGLHHENVLKLYGYFWDEDSVYLILEYAPGGEVFNLLKMMQRLSEDMVRKIVRQVCRGLKYLHENYVIHRDIKPQNILISGDTIKIADFGWSIQTDTRRETLCGTLDYLAPEIVKGQTHDNSIDVWQVGVLAYELAVGHPPFETNTHEQTYTKILTQQVTFPSFISFQLRVFIRTLLQKQSKNRLTIAQVLNLPFLSTKTAHQQ